MILLAEKINPLWILLSLFGILILSVWLYTKHIKKKYYYNIYSYASVKLALFATLGVGILLILNNKGVLSHLFIDSVSPHTINIILGIIALGLFTWVVYNNFRATNIWHSFPLSIIQISYVIILSPLYIFNIVLNILRIIKIDNGKNPNISGINNKTSAVRTSSSNNQSITSVNGGNESSFNDSSIIIRKYADQNQTYWWIYDGQTLKKYADQNQSYWWVYDGQILKKYADQNQKYWWVYDGQILKKYADQNQTYWWVYDGQTLKKYADQNQKYWWVYDGQTLKKYADQNQSYWWVTTGKVPIPVLAIAAGIIH